MNEELDELASAYVDGEASAEEIARVEGDPELLSLVEEFRALRQPSEVGDIDPARREQHISAALAAFDEVHGSQPSQLAIAQTDSQTNAGADDRLSERAAASPDSATTNVASLDQHRSRRRPPAWLLNAAAAVVVVGGVGFALTQLPDSSGGDDAAQVFDETELEAEAADLSSASGAAEETDAMADDASDAASSGAANEALTTLADEAGGAEEEAGDSMEDDAEASPAEDSAADDLAPEDSAAEAEDSAEPVPAVPVGGFDGTESASEVLQILAGDEAAEGLDIAELSPADQTDCFEAVDIDGEPLGFVPILYADEVAQLLVFDVQAVQTPVLVDESCAVLSAE